MCPRAVATAIAAARPLAQVVRSEDLVPARWVHVLVALPLARLAVHHLIGRARLPVDQIFDLRQLLGAFRRNVLQRQRRAAMVPHALPRLPWRARRIRPLTNPRGIWRGRRIWLTRGIWWIRGI